MAEYAPTATDIRDFVENLEAAARFDNPNLGEWWNIIISVHTNLVHAATRTIRPFTEFHGIRSQHRTFGAIAYEWLVMNYKQGTIREALGRIGHTKPGLTTTVTQGMAAHELSGEARKLRPWRDDNPPSDNLQNSIPHNDLPMNAASEAVPAGQVVIHHSSPHAHAPAPRQSGFPQATFARSAPALGSPQRPRTPCQSARNIVQTRIINNPRFLDVTEPAEDESSDETEDNADDESSDESDDESDDEHDGDGRDESYELRNDPNPLDKQYGGSNKVNIDPHIFRNANCQHQRDLLDQPMDTKNSPQGVDELEEFDFDAFIMENHDYDLPSNEVEHQAHDAPSQSATVFEDLDVSDDDHVVDDMALNQGQNDSDVADEQGTRSNSPSGKRKRGDEMHHHSAQRRRMY
uniref:Uncharacterized protein B2H10.090 n=1 Tax=Neurospora crassa TaxID=5141 RepID=Q6MFV5_NEUCS|nr:hypothetical protein [Neurospora crassa]